MARYLLGIDVGTSGCKSLLVDESGAVAARATAEYPIASPRPLWTEQHPEDWWTATVATIREVLEKVGVGGADVAALGLSGQMHGMVLLDVKGQVLRPCILWNDQRTGAECAEITERVGADRVIQLTGNPMLAGFTASKVAWSHKHEPDLFAAAAKCLLPKDYIRYRLTGEFITEPSDASGTAFFDITKLKWSEEMLAAIEMPPDWLPEITESPQAAAQVNSEAALLTGLLAGTPVAGGAGDQAAQAVGMGIVAEGSMSVAMGTSAVLLATSDTCRVEPHGRLHTFCHAVPGKWALMGVVLSAGGSLRWYRDTLCSEEKRIAAQQGRDPYEVIIETAAEAPPGCEGLIFLPYLTGNRLPHRDPHARGTFFGLTLRHSKKHLTRAILEGVSYGLNDSMRTMRSLGLETSAITASGGGARSVLWRQILADVFDAGINTVSVDEGAAFGAALLAGVAAGLYANVESACAEVVHGSALTAPSAAVALYADFYERYRRLYPALREEFAALSATVERHIPD
jgi:xylulokinase